MKRTALLASALLGFAGFASAFDSDPGYGPDRPWLEGGGSFLHTEHGHWYGSKPGDEAYYGGADSRILIPRYYRPTQRYYGNGYTVSYRYIPVFKTDYPRGGAVGESSNFPTSAAHLTTAQYDSFGNNLARLTQKDEKSGAPRTAVTSIVRKKPAGKTTRKGATDAAPAGMPAITPSTPASAPAPDAAAPQAAPATTGAPAKP